MNGMRYFEVTVVFAIVTTNPDLERLTGPDRAAFIRRKLQGIVESEPVREALREAGIELAFATVGMCREHRG